MVFQGPILVYTAWEVLHGRLTGFMACFTELWTRLTELWTRLTELWTRYTELWTRFTEL